MFVEVTFKKKKWERGRSEKGAEERERNIREIKTISLVPKKKEERKKRKQKIYA